MRLALALSAVMLTAAAPASKSEVPPAVIGNFTADAHGLYQIVQSACVVPVTPEFLARLKPLLARTVALETRAAGTAFAPILAKARGDQILLAGSVDCMLANPAGAADYFDTQITTLNQLLPRMERTVAHFSAKG